MGIIKKKTISENVWDYSFGLLGESGVGKTTVMAEICEKLVGEDGYAIFNTGKEQGIDCLQGVSYVDIPNWKTFDAAVKEIVKNKDTEYKDLKIIVFDTLDQLIEQCGEPETIRLWNSENLGKKDFTPVKTMNASWSGFGKAEDKCIQLILDKVWELKKVGITVYYTMHTKTRELVDPLTNNTYTILSTNMMQKYFNGFKTKIHICGIACVDRTIEVEKTGRKNAVTKKDVTINKVTESRRKVIFRDDNYGVDSKSRFAGIVEEVPLDADAIINAIKDAIEKEKSKKLSSATEPAPAKKTKSKKAEVKEVLESVEPIEDNMDGLFEEEAVEEINYAERLTAMFKANKDNELGSKIKSFIKDNGGKISAIPTSDLEEFYNEVA